ncbi:16S rRNA (uracil(1498)-N(3))-methyltransferase [Kangiella sp. HD9-110m-PIT-SAG07]|nr:16S rRNA (uracil(1498)-N(3))-methyltransferase [Kangiella sp. HD9-110m-PIT-SAG07]
MRVPRIYTAEDLSVGKLLHLDKEASNHLSRVLRLKAGNEIILFNGSGLDFESTIETIDRSQITVHIKNSLEQNIESPLQIHLFQGVSRGDKMDLTLQKGVELGIKEFTPLLTERCGVKLDPKRWQKKIQHWEKVIQSACEQCGRSSIPKLNPVIDLASALAAAGNQNFFLHPESSNSFKTITDINPGEPIALWIGPEGGFSDKETAQVRSQGITPVQLGPRILRTETAALAAVSAMNTIWGDFS